MSVCVQCGREYPGERPGICASCLQKEAELKQEGTEVRADQKNAEPRGATLEELLGEESSEQLDGDLLDLERMTTDELHRALRQIPKNLQGYSQGPRRRVRNGRLLDELIQREGVQALATVPSTVSLVTRLEALHGAVEELSLSDVLTGTLFHAEDKGNLDALAIYFQVGSVAKQWREVAGHVQDIERATQRLMLRGEYSDPELDGDFAESLLVGLKGADDALLRVTERMLISEFAEKSIGALFVLRHADAFPGMNPTNVAQEIIKTRTLEDGGVDPHLDHDFEQIEVKGVERLNGILNMAFIGQGESGAELLEHPLKGMSKDIAEQLIEEGYGLTVLARSELFDDFTPSRYDAIRTFASAEYSPNLLRAVSQVDGVDLDDTFILDALNWLATSDDPYVFATSVDFAEGIINDLDAYHIEDSSRFLEQLLDFNYLPIEYAASRLQKFKGLDNNLARRFLDVNSTEIRYFKPGSEVFPAVDQSIAVELLMRGYFDLLKGDLEQYPEAELEGMQRDIWEFFTDREVPLRVKQAQETGEALFAYREGAKMEGPEKTRTTYMPPGVAVALPVDTVLLLASSYLPLNEYLRSRVTHNLQPKHRLLLEKFIRTATNDVHQSPSGGDDADSATALAHRIANAEAGSKEMRELIAQWMVGEGADDALPDPAIRDQFAELLEHVGADIALQYLNRPDLPIHDGVEFLTLSGNGIKAGHHDALLRPELLKQVAADNATYDEGTAHHRYKSIFEGLGFNAYELPDGYGGYEHISESASVEEEAAKTLARAREYESIEKLQKLVGDFDQDGASPFDSWKSLKKFYEVHQLMRRTEILDELVRGDLSPKMRAFVETLAFHPNISLSRVMQFWRQPAEFLHINDEHTEGRVNAVKKPSNYLSLPYLGLRAEDLRDAYVEGTLDQLQLLPPMERTYRLGIHANDDPSTAVGLHRYLRDAVGQQRKGIAPQAQRGKLVFSHVQRFCKENGIAFKELWSLETGPRVLEGLPRHAKDALEGLIFEEGVGMKRPELEGEEYRIRIGAKSDPEMTVAGNDTASCMPFGSGKNNVYMFNPNCVQLVVERKRSDGTFRTAAQSVTTIDLETTHATPKLLERYKDGRAHLKDLLNDEDLLGKYVLTCDNIEVAKNEEGKQVARLREVYERFLKEYLEQYAEGLGLDPTRVAVGQAYTPGALGLNSEKNTFVPLAPMGYSDNVGEYCYVIKTGIEVDEEKLATISTGEPGISALRIQDVIPVAVLEGKAFSDNLSVVENLHGMQNNLIGMKIANDHFERPNLSFMYRDSEGVPRGYMLAYEGRNGDLEEVYIADIATDVDHASGKLAGGKLIREFFSAYTESYGTEDRPYLPIAAEARSQTSYRILERQLERLTKRAGLVSELVVVSEDDVRGGETFYHVRIFVGRDQAEIDVQKEQFDSVPLEMVGHGIDGDGDTDYQYSGGDWDDDDWDEDW